MAPNVNSLTYLCLDKIMELTENTPPNPCQDSLEWISRAWSFIHLIPNSYQSYSNLLLSKSRFGLRESISTLSCHLPITYYEKNKLLYTCLDEKYYAILKENVFLMSHLSNGVTHLHLKKCLHQPKHLATVPIRTFLKNCKSVNTVTFCENLISSDQFFRIEFKCKNWNDITDDEYDLILPVGTESLLLDCLTVCPKIEIIENLQTVSVEIFSKYILGVNLNSCLDIDEINDIKSILSLSKPSWPKLKSVQMPFNCYLDLNQLLHVHNLCFLILQDFQNGHPKESNSTLISQLFLQQVFRSTEKEMAVKLLPNKFEFVDIANFDFYFREGLLANGVTTIDLEMNSPQLGDSLNILKARLNVLDRRIKILVSKRRSDGMLSNYEKLLDIEEYPFILNNITIVRICHNYVMEPDTLEAVTNIVTAASNLQILQLEFHSSFTIPKRSLFRQCRTSVPTLCIRTFAYEFYHETVEFCMIIFPCVQHLSLIIENDLHDVSITDGKFDYVKQLQNLKSFHINLNNFTIDTKDLLLLLDKISFDIDRNVKLFYSVNSRHLDRKILSILRNRGWHLYRE